MRLRVLGLASMYSAMAFLVVLAVDHVSGSDLLDGSLDRTLLVLAYVAVFAAVVALSAGDS